jgi:ornithine cyclodeaminase
MIHINETQSARLISHEMAFAAITRALIAAASPASSIFPVVLGHASDPQNRFTIKSGADADLTGLKIGSYFPTNDRLGLPRHDSVILLFDQTKGKIGAIVEAGKLNAYRTAAADAVATDVLARKDASTVALFGTGHQAEYEALACRTFGLSKKFSWWAVIRCGHNLSRNICSQRACLRKCREPNKPVPRPI